MPKVYVVQIDNMESNTNNIIVGVCESRLAAQQLIARINANPMELNDAYYEEWDVLNRNTVNNYDIEY